MSNRERAKQRVREAKHQRKTDEADIVLYDAKGNWVFEVYTAPGATTRVT